MATAQEVELAVEIREYFDDPLGFVVNCYPWGEPGPLEQFSGPDEWQRNFLAQLGKEVRAGDFNGRDPIAALRFAVASGHGIGKSTVVAWIVNWIMSTRPFCQGTVTANTFTQLETKTWAAILKWTKLCVTSSWFVAGAKRVYHREHPETWFVSPQSCREENSEAFAGQHAATSTSFYVFDEASAVPDKIWEVAEGGLTDGEPMLFAFGNPTRNTGKFYRCCFGSEQRYWTHASIDSRECMLTNKAQIAEWQEQYGEDSDFFRVRVRGLPPRAGELQFIGQDLVWEGQQRQTFTLPDEPLIAGVDVSGGGAAWNVVRFRRGTDARSIPPIRIPGEAVRGDRSAFLGVLAAVLYEAHPEKKVAMMFVDSAFGAPYVERLRSMGFRNVEEVSFGAKSLDSHQANMRAFMWGSMKEWLVNGAIPERDLDLEIGLTGPGYHIDRQNRLVIESKADMVKRGVASPDDADALALTFAQAVAPRPQLAQAWPMPTGGETGWMGM